MLPRAIDPSLPATSGSTDVDPGRAGAPEHGDGSTTGGRRRAALTAALPVAVPVLWSVLLTVVVIGPLTGRGWVLLLDWTTGPAVQFPSRVFDGSGLPAGPAFFGAAAVLQLLGGAAVGWLVPAACLVVAGCSAARLGGSSLTARMAAATAYLWNPFVHERLYAGQLALLAGYAVLPNVAVALVRHLPLAAPPGEQRPDAVQPEDAGPEAARPEEGGPEAGRRRGDVVGPAGAAGAWLALATACSVHLLLLGALVPVAVFVAASVGRRTFDPRQRRVLRRRAVGSVVGLGALTALWLPAIAASAPSPGSIDALDSFATRADPSLGLALGTLAQRGFWRPSPGEPGSALGWWWAPLVGLLLGIGLLGVAVAWRRRGSGAALAGAALCAALPAWILAWGTAGPFGASYRWSVEHLPGVAVLRESGKFLALLPLAAAVGLAAATTALAAAAAARRPVASLRSGRRALAAVIGLGAVAASLVVAPIGLTPGLAGGVGGRLEPTRFPAVWAEVRATVDAAGPPGVSGRMVVLPWNGYLDPGFTGQRVVRNPAPAYFGTRAEVSDDPGLAGLRGSARSSRIATVLDSTEPSIGLAELGIGWLLVNPPLDVRFRDPGLELVVDRDGVQLYRNVRFGGVRPPQDR